MTMATDEEPVLPEISSLIVKTADAVAGNGGAAEQLLQQLKAKDGHPISFVIKRLEPSGGDAQETRGQEGRKPSHEDKWNIALSSTAQRMTQEAFNRAERSTSNEEAARLIKETVNLKAALAAHHQQWKHRTQDHMNETLTRLAHGPGTAVQKEGFSRARVEFEEATSNPGTPVSEMARRARLLTDHIVRAQLRQSG